MNDIPDAKLQALQHFCQEIRKLIDGSLQFDASIDVINQLSQSINIINQQLNQLGGTRPLPHYHLPSALTDCNNTLPYSPICGPYNPVAPPIDLHYNSETRKVIGNVVCGRAYEGPPGMVHGGIITGFFDQILAMASTCLGQPSYTAYLHTTFLKPTPLQQALTFCSWIDNIDGRKILIKGECQSQGEILTRAEGLFIQLKPR